METYRVQWQCMHQAFTFPDQCSPGEMTNHIGGSDDVLAAIFHRFAQVSSSESEPSINTLSGGILDKSMLSDHQQCYPRNGAP